MKRKLTIITIIIITTISCGLFGPKLPKYNGVYYKSNREYIEIEMLTRYPNQEDYFKLIDTDNQPEFLFYEPSIRIDTVELYNISEGGISYHPFSYRVEANNVINVDIDNKLDIGFYCFDQGGDMFSIPGVSNRWCFSVGMAAERSNLDRDLQMNLDTHSLGVFVADNERFVELSSGEIDELFKIRDFYILSSRYPVVAVRSEFVNPNQFSLYRLRPAIGISFSTFGAGEISSVNKECIAHQVGILPGDKIISVNGITTNPDDYRETLALLVDNLSFTRATNLRIARQAMILEFSVIADCIIFDATQFTSEIKHDYYVFYPTILLQQDNFYCYSEDRVHGYCFSLSSE